ncbi:MAG: hypothetical protein WCD37_00045, partial [Chloroflexia bacterium]
LVLIVLLLPIILVFIVPFPENYTWLTAFRDAAIIYASFFMCVGALLLIVVAVLIGMIVMAVQGKIVPALEKVDDTAKTVRGTATFVSESVVAPIIKVAGAAAGAKAMVQTLMRGGKPKGKGKKEEKA